MKRSTIRLFVLLLTVWAAAVFQSPAYAADKVQPVPDVYVSTGFPQVVIVSGADYEMGVQYGQQSAARIAHNVAILKNRLYGPYSRDTVNADMKVWDYYIKKYTPGMSEWFKGMVAGCKDKGYTLDYYDMVLSAVYPTELWARPKVTYPQETGVQPVAKTTPAGQGDINAPHSCNGFAATGEATSDGKAILAFDSMVSTDAMDNIILIAFPKTGAAFLTQSAAGKLAGNFGMNSNKFAWAMTAIFDDKPQWGLTEGYFQWLCQTPKTPAEAEKFIVATPRGGVAGGFIMADPTNVMVLESNAKRYHMRTPGQASETGKWLVQTNHLIDPSLQADNPPWLGFTDSPNRYTTVFQYLKEATTATPATKIDWRLAKAIFASDDYYDGKKGEWVRNQPGKPGISNNHITTTLNIFEPNTLTAYLATGMASGNGSPAYATGEYVKLQLLETPKKIADKADADTQSIYWDANDTFQRELNTKAAYLTLPVIADIKDKLNKAWYAYSKGLDRLSYGTLQSDANTGRTLFATALTYYAEAQMYAQMAKTSLLRAKGL